MKGTLIYAIVSFVLLIWFLKSHDAYFSSKDKWRMSLGTLILTTIFIVGVAFWLKASGGGSMIWLFIGSFSYCMGWIVPLITFGPVFVRVAVVKSRQKSGNIWFSGIMAFILTIFIAPALNFGFLFLCKATTMSLLHMIRPFCEPFELWLVSVLRHIF